MTKMNKWHKKYWLNWNKPKFVPKNKNCDLNNNKKVKCKNVKINTALWLTLFAYNVRHVSNLNLVAVSYQLPNLEGKPNLTALDIQIKNLRDKTMASVKEAAIRMREEAVDVRATMPDIEDWLERLQQITEEVWHCLMRH